MKIKVLEQDNQYHTWTHLYTRDSLPIPLLSNFIWQWGKGRPEKAGNGSKQHTHLFSSSLSSSSSSSDIKSRGWSGTSVSGSRRPGHTHFNGKTCKIYRVNSWTFVVLTLTDGEITENVHWNWWTNTYHIHYKDSLFMRVKIYTALILKHSTGFFFLVHVNPF